MEANQILSHECIDGPIITIGLLHVFIESFNEVLENVLSTWLSSQELTSWLKKVLQIFSESQKAVTLINYKAEDFCFMGMAKTD